MEIARAGAATLDAIEPLWASMVEHHRAVYGDVLAVKRADDAWAIRRREYEGWLADGSGTLFVATDASRTVGYAMLRTVATGATWDAGERMGDLESLAVAPEARGAGVGTKLMDACREELRRLGIEYWTVSVVEANRDATRLYEREGFDPYYRALLARV